MLFIFGFRLDVSSELLGSLAKMHLWITHGHPEGLQLLLQRLVFSDKFLYREAVWVHEEFPIVILDDVQGLAKLLFKCAPNVLLGGVLHTIHTKALQ